MRQQASRQLELSFKGTWGGKRRNAGRKPSAHPKTPHRARPRHYRGHPVHVTLRAGLGSLRSQVLYPSVRLAITLATRKAPDSFRIVHFSVQSNHVHLIVEAAERRALTAGVHGLEARITRYINGLLRRRGALWADRWHGRALKSPREVRNAIVYVLANFRKHSSKPQPLGADPCSSGAWFQGWRGLDVQRGPPPLAGRAWTIASADEKVPVSEPRTWLLRKGFLKAGKLGLDEAPRPQPGRNPPRRSAIAP